MNLFLTLAFLFSIGSTFGWVATAENGWHAVVVNGRVGWVSGKYAERV